jgi:DNA polymerase III epsilon subunit-like protein
MNILFFDTETTGLPDDYNASFTKVDNWPRLVQLAWILADEHGNVIEENNLIVHPDGFVIPEESSDVHGITQEIATLKGKHISEVLYKFNTAIQKADAVAGHNVSFDCSIVDCEYYRTSGFKPLLYSMEKFCTKEAGTPYTAIQNRFGFKWPNLQELHVKCFGKEFDGAHDALADVRATRDCFYHLLENEFITIDQ